MIRIISTGALVAIAAIAALAFGDKIVDNLETGFSRHNAEIRTTVQDVILFGFKKVSFNGQKHIAAVHCKAKPDPVELSVDDLQASVTISKRLLGYSTTVSFEDYLVAKDFFCKEVALALK
jgi:hypothetical protein